MPTYTVNESEKSNRCLSMIYNRSTGTIFGRTALDWGRLLVFYVAFYGVLAAIFFGQLTVFMDYVITDSVPYRTGEDSILGLNPGIAAWPKQELASIKTSTNESSNLYKTYVKSRADALSEFSNESSQSLINCNFTENTKSIDDVNKVCKFERSLLEECDDPETEMNRGNVCVYWKMNRIYGYIPDIKDTSFADTILLKCEGQNKHNNDNLGQPIYYPSIVAGDGNSYGKFSHAFFPFINQPDYQNQLVAVQFPNITKNVIVQIKCNLINLKKESNPTMMDVFVSTA